MKNRSDHTTSIPSGMWRTIIDVMGPIVPTSSRYNAAYTTGDFGRMILKASTCDTSVGGTAEKKSALSDYNYEHDVAG